MIGRRGFLRAGAGAISLGPGRLLGQDEPKPKSSKSESVTASETLNRVLAPVRDDHHLPGLIGAVVTGDTLAAIGAVGVRKVGSKEPIRVTDKVHLGSCTKAMTATLIGLLVDEGKLAWNSTLGEVFPKRASGLPGDVRGINLLDLLTHRAGLPHDPSGSWWNLPGRTPAEQRLALLDKGGPLDTPLVSRPGTTHAYSNFGYALAGLMAEHVTRTSWEDLMRQRLFKSLDMTSAGFGPPGKKGKVDQPWGHRTEGGSVVPVQGDNAPSLGPAGTVHCSVPDWGKFASLHLRAAQGKPRLLKASTFRTLHTPPPGQTYAAGWGVTESSGSYVLSHDGSNTMWYCSVLIVPAANFAVLAATNFGGKGADKGCSEAVGALLKYHTKPRPRRR